MLNDLHNDNWINLYIEWELLLIKELGFEDTLSIKKEHSIKKALIFNKQLLMEIFIIPNKLKFPLFRNILENYFI